MPHRQRSAPQSVTPLAKARWFLFFLPSSSADSEKRSDYPSLHFPFPVPALLHQILFCVWMDPQEISAMVFWNSRAYHPHPYWLLCNRAILLFFFFINHMNSFQNPWLFFIFFLILHIFSLKMYRDTLYSKCTPIYVISQLRFFAIGHMSGRNRSYWYRLLLTPTTLFILYYQIYKQLFSLHNPIINRTNSVKFDVDNINSSAWFLIL